MLRLQHRRRYPALDDKSAGCSCATTNARRPPAPGRSETDERSANRWRLQARREPEARVVQPQRIDRLADFTEDAVARHRADAEEEDGTDLGRRCRVWSGRGRRAGVTVSISADEA